MFFVGIVYYEIQMFFLLRKLSILVLDVISLGESPETLDVFGTQDREDIVRLRSMIVLFRSTIFTDTQDF
ncbi:MAG: hypothetical protein ACHQ1H_07565 [Nitrososphaerales archaeon]